MRDRRLSSTLHALLHLAEHDEAMTSEAMAACMRTNPVVVRRLLGGLREAGLVAAHKGHGGGWRLARSLDEISLADVYAALGIEPGAPRKAPQPECRIERAVVAHVAAAQAEADALLAERLAQISLRQIANDYERRAAPRRARRNP